jgi:flagellar protein FliO/FliZ
LGLFLDIVDFARYLSALMLVLALVGFAALAARRFGMPGIMSGSATRRLAVVETLMLDARHKLYILRRDDKEHLVLVGPEGSSVLEGGIAAKLPVVSAVEGVMP